MLAEEIERESRDVDWVCSRASLQTDCFNIAFTLFLVLFDEHLDRVAILVQIGRLKRANDLTSWDSWHDNLQIYIFAILCVKFNGNQLWLLPVTVYDLLLFLQSVLSNVVLAAEDALLGRVTGWLVLLLAALVGDFPYGLVGLLVVDEFEHEFERLILSRDLCLDEF